MLFDLGYVSSAEPFHRLVNQGDLQLPAYKDQRGFYVPANKVVESDGSFFFEGAEVEREFGKIGKSLKNVVSPDAVIAEWGVDTFRLFEMFSGRCSSRGRGMPRRSSARSGCCSGCGVSSWTRRPGRCTCPTAPCPTS